MSVLSTSLRALAVSGLVGLTAGAGAADLTFARDVAPILQKRCQECHRPGEAVPMALMSYEDVRPWVKSVLKVVNEGEMPPWHADPSVGHWKNDRRMTAEEIAAINAWAAAGALPGDPKDMPAPIAYTEGWKIGTPDVVFTFEEDVVLPPELEDEYIYVTMKTNFTEDRWLNAIECRPGNVDVVHHIIAFGKPSGMAMRGEGGRGDGPRVDGSAPEGGAGGASRKKGNGGLGGIVALGGMAPGTAPMVLPEGQGILLPAGSDIVFQMHYHKEPGAEARDSSMIGLKFADYVVKEHKYSDAISNVFFNIPPNTANHEVSAVKIAEEDMLLQTVMPHMHLRGKSMRVWAKFPDGVEKDLLWVPKYDFNWQTIYEPAEPIFIPKGTKLYAKAVYDNSTGNPFNPNPNETVRFGEPTTAEMMFAFYSYTIPGENLNATDPSFKKTETAGAGE